MNKKKGFLRVGDLKIYFKDGKFIIEGLSPDGKNAKLIIEPEEENKLKVTMTDGEIKEEEIIDLSEFREFFEDLDVRKVFDSRDVSKIIGFAINTIQFFIENWLGKTLSDLTIPEKF